MWELSPDLNPKSQARAQVYRALRPALRPEAAGALLGGLQRCLEDATPAALSSASQLVVTLQVTRTLHA